MRDTSQYWVDGERWPSVTECLDMIGLPELAGIPPETLARAAERGQMVHAWCDLEDTEGIQVDIDPDLQGYVDAYRRFKRELGVEILTQEMKVKHEGYKYVGTLDRIARLRKSKHPDDPFVFDIKAASMESPSTRLQVAGYALAVKDSARNDRRYWIVRRGSVRLRPDGKYQWRTHRDESDTQDFLAAVRLAHFKLRNGLATLH